MKNIADVRGNNDKTFYAHSKNARGEKHRLSDHLLSTAELVRSYSPSKELEHLFYIAGLLHDVGKYQNGFQQYLEHGKPKTPHAGIGAFIARRLLKEFISLPFAIKGHHTGMPDKEELVSAIELIDNELERVLEVEKCLFKDFPQIENQLNGERPFLLSDKLLMECATRLVFSALTDGDWLDTEHHFRPEITERRKSHTLNYDSLIAALQRTLSELPDNGRINALRTKARNEVTEQHTAPPGFFSLQLPTGLGKTLTSMYWALLHARHHGLKRIIIVLPYINIIDQTARILKGIFGEDAILEHHSGIVEEDTKNDNYDENAIGEDNELSKRLACENWDAPIIITTSVQFFESLFSNRPFKSRKNHNISEAVVIFDEVQTLPKQYAEPIIVMLKNISNLARTTFLFCTATQPAFAKRDDFDGIEYIQPLIERPEEYFKPTQRVNYTLIHKLKEISLDELTAKLSKETTSLLAIANTKSVARELYERVSQFKTYDECFHLSTGMCPHHRKNTIERIITDLQPKSGKRIAVLSTQLVEAGVDFDFPCVYRAIAPLDSVIQAAGRCNRNGNLKKGRVVLFNLEKQRMPDQTYKAAADVALRMIKDDPELLLRADSFERYYEEFTGLFVDTDKYDITENRRKGNFKTVAENFRLIDSPTASLFIQDYSEESRSLLREIQISRFITRGDLRSLQQYSVQVYRQFLTKYSDQIEYFKDTLYIWHGTYDNNIGIAPEDISTVF